MRTNRQSLSPRSNETGESKVSIRTCVACREPAEKMSLVRIVRRADGEVCVDASGKMPGRGAYVCAKKECIDLAIKHKRLGRALRGEIPESLIRELEAIVVNNDAEH